MAASKGNLWMGCKVILQASSGVWQTVKKSVSTLTSLNSGKYLPACLITQTGALSTSSPRAALSRRSFCRGGKLWAIWNYYWNILFYYTRHTKTRFFTRKQRTYIDHCLDRLPGGSRGRINIVHVGKSDTLHTPHCREYASQNTGLGSSSNTVRMFIWYLPDSSHLSHLRHRPRHQTHQTPQTPQTP